MKIMPVAGSDIGFSSKQWKRVEASVSKIAQDAQYTDADEDNYFTDIKVLKAKSVSKGETETEEQTELVYAPGSNWGGREKHLGFDYSINVEVTLEGDVRYPYGGTDQEVSTAISEYFDENWQENAECSAIVKDASAELLGTAEEIEHSAVVSSIAKISDKAYRVTIVFSAYISKYDSVSDAKQRDEDERGERRYERSREDEL